MMCLDKNRTMDNVQKRNICINVPSSQTFRSYSGKCLLNNFIRSNISVYYKVVEQTITYFKLPKDSLNSEINFIKLLTGTFSVTVDINIRLAPQMFGHYKIL
jgi:hypothetical protein